MDITNSHTAGRTSAEVAQRLYEALDALMDELGGPAAWDADVELLFRRQTLERALLALDEADLQGYGCDTAPPRFMRKISPS
jgi:hypothetical protein